VRRARHFVWPLVVGPLVACAAMAGQARAESAVCDRDCLSAMIGRYLKAMVAHQPSALPLAKTVRFTEDSVEMPLGSSRLWGNASKLRDYRLDVIDAREQTAATLAIVDEGGMPVMLALRLKLDGGKLSEVESLVTRNKAEGSLFQPETLLRSPSGAMLMKPDDALRASRQDAIRIAELYPAGLKAGSFVTVDVPFAPGTYRLENGMLMAGPGCTFLPHCDDIKGQHIPTLSGITYRVAAVDEDMGIVLLRQDFGVGSSRVPGNAIVAWEAFKVYGGQIHAVEAFMKNMPLGTPSGWDSTGGN
jgi:hypothetical protein